MSKRIVGDGAPGLSEYVYDGMVMSVGAYHPLLSRCRRPSERLRTGVERANVFESTKLMFRLVSVWTPPVLMPFEYLAPVWLVTSLTVVVTLLRATPLSTTTLVLVLMVLCITLRPLYLTLIAAANDVRVCVTLTVCAMLLVVLTRPLPSTMVADRPQWRPSLLLTLIVVPLNMCTFGAAPCALMSMAPAFLSVVVTSRAQAVTLSTCRRQPSVMCLFESSMCVLLCIRFMRLLVRILLLLMILNSIESRELSSLKA